MQRFYILCFLIFFASGAFAIDKGLQIFRVGTGPSAGSSYFVGIKLAGFISKPAGSLLSCEQSGLCGVPGLIASIQTQSGFVDGIKALRSGELEALLMPADIAYSAYQGNELFSSFTPYEDLRVFASLKPEHLHIIVRGANGIESLADLRGKRISVGWAQSGVPLLAEYILSLHGISEADITAVSWDANESLDALSSGRIDAAFLMEASGAESITQLFRNGNFKLLGLSGNDLLSVPIATPYIDTAVIDSSFYGLQDSVNTISVDLLWLTRNDMSPDLIEKITRALWNDDRSRAFLKWSHLSNSDRAALHLEKGSIDGIPFHDGSMNYFGKLVRLISDEK